MTVHKSRVAVGAKLWLDIAFFGGLALASLFALWLAFSPMSMSTDSESTADAAVSVAIGSGTLRPVAHLEVARDRPGSVYRASLVKGRGELRFQTTSWALQFATNLTMLIGLGFILYIIHLLRNILRTVLEGDPFAVANIRRLRIIGLILLFGGFAVALAEYLMARIVLARIPLEGVELSPPLDVNETAVLTGLLLLVLATVWQHGADLERDQSLTV
jgi:hypothetical protein